MYCSTIFPVHASVVNYCAITGAVTYSMKFGVLHEAHSLEIIGRHSQFCFKQYVHLYDT